jgi:hypothetical protein
VIREGAEGGLVGGAGWQGFSWLFAKIKALIGALFFDVFWRVKLSVRIVEASCVNF